MNYEDFLSKRNQIVSIKTIEPKFIPAQAMDFQRHLVGWALATERAALFADCGMGKKTRDPCGVLYFATVMGLETEPRKKNKKICR